ncbi:inverse autotransporter beta domain-containing protein [unidentified bacterial endosymbiont]|uniref:inverse autotransporter beta domain-containing protein n=1 Tax=unidentified bacterial endosymbiont TaxID=2355 RepID=UPI00209F0DAE|nr:inverse autotransporter beta domain-containing protein [unidentified bacterial endosymbiont]
MSYLINRVTVLLTSSFSMLLAILPAIASHPIHTVQPNSQAGGVSRQWRGSRGTVVVDWPLNRSNSRSQQRGAISGLLRLGDDATEIPFAQLGLNHYPSGQLLSIGVGQRWWNGADTRWGLNLFYDYQLKEHHQRCSVGSEIQHDFLKLAVNGYLPLSGNRALKNSLTDFTRPARGVDAHVAAYVPQFPWLGLRGEWSYDAGTPGILVEQEFKKSRAPTRVILGLNVIPFPLFKISYDYRIGKQQINAHRVALQLTYQFNRSLKEQLQSDQVRHFRSCEGGQLELVSRRYLMVLNKTTSITGETPKKISEAEEKENFLAYLSHLENMPGRSEEHLKLIRKTKKRIQFLFDDGRWDFKLVESTIKKLEDVFRAR